ncbi:Uncharacterized membrane protein YoaK, UPF0700 family [Enhydrobacter aerosaccus]|uniref:Uncharacterized membrane protein YoaK, UPF0700 family n=1 Tax=Enhydrobacter aerosaccus TaxID=225324 RepID=A0A1T4QBQ9_9HYPH|nr:YoaK family protein [Enhydrobacter aerosaccus]SKA01223.1 Uncharacterized membrane protein YoaK, UPF0700 family [Enhydrobacter aerosaccus]
MRPALQATTLTLVAGIADAVGYLTMGGIFAANMTGNTVLAGIALAQGDYGHALYQFAALAAFVVGAVLSHFLLRLTARPTAGLLAEAVLIAGIGFLPIQPELQAMIVAAAMGLQASAITQFGGVSISTVVITSTLARIADSLLDRFRPVDAKSERSAALNLHLLPLSWAGYLAGAFAGTLMIAILPWPLLAAAVLLLLMLVFCSGDTTEPKSQS